MALALAAAVLPPVAEATQLFDYNVTNEANPPFWAEVYQNQQVAQSFNASADYDLAAIGLRVEDANKADALRIDLRPSLVGLPNNNISLANATAATASTGSWYWLTFNLNTTLHLTKGQTLWIVASDLKSIRNGYLWGSSNINAYAQGVVAYKLSGGTWVTFDGDDQLFKTFGTPHAATLGLAARVNRATAEPGDPLHLQLFYNNTGVMAANQAWINYTLPAGVAFLSSQPAPTAVSSSVVRWLVAPVAAGNHSLEVNLSLATNLVDGTVVANTATLEYQNETGVQQALATDTATTVVRAPTVIASKTTNVSQVTPGVVIAYTILYFNVGSRPAARLTIQDYLPPALTFQDSSAEANRTVGTNWTFLAVQPGTYTLTVRARVSPLAGTGVLVNTVNLRTYNARGQLLQNISGAATVTIGAAQPPQMSLALSLDRTWVARGGVVVLTLAYANAGPGRAGEAWVNLTLPPEARLVGTSVLPTVQRSNVLAWHLTDLGPGNGSVEVQFRVANDATSSRLVPTANLTYADSTGRWVGTVSAFAILEVEVPPSANPEYLWGGLLISLAIIVGFILVRRGALGWLLRRRAAFEEIFLLHRSGLLIRHYSRSLRADMDTDVVGGMLVAVQEFVKDSFRGAGLKELKVGKNTILVAQGQLTTLAASISGPRAERITQQLVAAVAEIELRFGTILENWNGITENMAGADEVIKKLLTGRYGWRYLRRHPPPPVPGPRG